MRKLLFILLGLLVISCSARRTQSSHVSELLAESTFDSTSTTSAIDTTITTAADTMSYDIGLDYLSLLGEKSIEANFPSGKIKISKRGTTINFEAVSKPKELKVVIPGTKNSVTKRTSSEKKADQDSSTKTKFGIPWWIWLILIVAIVIYIKLKYF
jgi:hypothetical protein